LQTSVGIILSLVFKSFVSPSLSSVHGQQMMMIAHNAFGVTLGVGLLFNFCSLFRLSLFSHFVGEIRMAQTFSFYGSLLSQFVLTTFSSLIVSTAQDGDASSPVACTVLDPPCLPACLPWSPFRHLDSK
jgi:hypothetical protein